VTGTTTTTVIQGMIRAVTLDATTATTSIAKDAMAINASSALVDALVTAMVNANVVEQHPISRTTIKGVTLHNNNMLLTKATVLTLTDVDLASDMAPLMEATLVDMVATMFPMAMEAMVAKAMVDTVAKALVDTEAKA
jgi:hypothetical protein